MSKEMIIIALGLWTVVLTQLGIPYHPWGVILFVITGAAVAVTGFLLRGESLSNMPGKHTPGQRHATFAESSPIPAETQPQSHDHQGITPLN